MQHFIPETENVEFYYVAKKWFDGSHLLFEQTDLLHEMVKVSSVSCCVLF